jgi:hypothetical protein
MFNKLFAACVNLFHFNHSIDLLANIIDHLESDYIKDGNAKDASIDAMCDILQSHKTTAIVAPSVAQPANTVGK